MLQDVVGIDSEKIDQLALSFYDYIEKLNAILNNISTEINNVSKFLDCKAVNDLKEKYDDQKTNFSSFSARLLDYTDVLLDIKSKYLMKSSDLAAKISLDSRNIDVILPREKS